MSIDQFIIVPVSIVSFLVLLGFIVFFHEYGHFSVARMLGIRVDTFSIGFGKPLFNWMDKKGTEWRIARWPLGGYVKFFGDLNAASQADPSLSDDRSEGAEGKSGVRTEFPTGENAALASSMSEEDRKVCFHFKPVWARAMVVAAGPFANFLLSIVIFASLLLIFGRAYIAPTVGQVIEDSAAAEAGFIPGDRILSINGKEIKDFQDISSVVQLGTGEQLSILVDRGGKSVTLTAIPRREESEDAFGNKVSMGRLGIGAGDSVEFSSVGPIEAIASGADQVFGVITTTVRFIGRLVRGKESFEQLGGPIKMAKFSGQAATIGFSDKIRDDVSFGDRLTLSLRYWITLTAFISVSIGFLNLLPIPVLDGGHLMYYGYEAVAGKPVGQRVQMAGYQIGLLILMSFMIFVTWNDITGLLSSTFTSNG